MASAEPPSAAVGDTREAQVAPDLPTQDSQPTQSSIPSLPSSAPAQTGEDEDPSTESPPTKSLFGPFPPSMDADLQPNATSEPSQLPTSSPPDQIEPTSENQQVTSQFVLKYNPQNDEPVSAAQTNKPGSPNRTALPPLSREKTTPAIGPATDKPTPVPKESEMEGPVLFITLLLSSNGARHPYKLDEKYLRKRNVIVEGNNPINISLYKLKELILRDWRDEWEAKPSSPESIRLISMGKMLNDKSRLSDSGFTNGLTPHIIHMTLKPQEIVDEEDAKMKAGGSNRGENERSPGCRCVIQ